MKVCRSIQKLFFHSASGWPLKRFCHHWSVRPGFLHSLPRRRTTLVRTWRSLARAALYSRAAVTGDFAESVKCRTTSLCAEKPPLVEWVKKKSSFPPKRSFGRPFCLFCLAAAQDIAHPAHSLSRLDELHARAGYVSGRRNLTDEKYSLYKQGHPC